MSRTPRTPAEWQQAVDLAAFWLLVGSARQYGLIEGGPTINVERCQWILVTGQERGYQPRDLLEAHFSERVVPEQAPSLHVLPEDGL